MYRKTLLMHLRDNAEMLTAGLLDERAATYTVKPIYSRFARIESFGDTRNATHAQNYIRVTAAHPETEWGIWTKNEQHYAAAYAAEGKPSNAHHIHSSIMLNTPDTNVPNHADAVFTVYDNETAYNAAVEAGAVPCKGVSCMQCRACYTARRGENGPIQIAEFLR